MHLRRVAIRNYRSLVKADLVLGRITVVIGPSDSGKSNLIRALRDWAYYTTAQDISTWGSGSPVRVAVAIGEKDKVVFEKLIKLTTPETKQATKGSSAKYVHKDAETGEIRQFEKIGRTVPQEIIDLTGIQVIRRATATRSRC